MQKNVFFARCWLCVQVGEGLGARKESHWHCSVFIYGLDAILVNLAKDFEGNLPFNSATVALLVDAVKVNSFQSGNARSLNFSDRRSRFRSSFSPEKVSLIT